MRKIPIVLVMKCDTPSKKKNYSQSQQGKQGQGTSKLTLDVFTVITSITQLAATTVSSAMMLKTLITLRTM